MSASTTASIESTAWRALGTVLDPELDRPVTELGFVASFGIDGNGTAELELRLPTYFCAPNFAYLMVADAHDALVGVPGIRHVRVRLLDHFASTEINAGVAAGAGFGAAFPGLAADELDDLRRTFLRKAHLAHQERLATRLLRAGYTHEQLVHVRLRDLVDGEVPQLRRRREQLGLPAGPDAHLVVDEHGRPVDAESLPLRLRYARTTRVSIEGNAAWCRGLLATRYGERETRGHASKT